MLFDLWFGLRSSPSPENMGSFAGFGGGSLAGPGSAIVCVGRGGGGSGSSGGEVSFLGRLVLSGPSIKVPGIDCSLECVCESTRVSGRLPNSPATRGARHLLAAEGRAGVRSVSETSCAAALAASPCSSTCRSSVCIICSVLSSSSESVSRSAGRSAVSLGASTGPGVGPGVGSWVVGSGVSVASSAEGLS